jgi:hypothetical protein
MVELRMMTLAVARVRETQGNTHSWGVGDAANRGTCA